jgi:hypothetical protein
MAPLKMLMSSALKVKIENGFCFLWKNAGEGKKIWTVIVCA